LTTSTLGGGFSAAAALPEALLERLSERSG